MSTTTKVLWFALLIYCVVSGLVFNNIVRLLEWLFLLTAKLGVKAHFRFRHNAKCGCKWRGTK